jgi:3-oxoacyl-[acyl-carrier protein] reductase
MDTGLKAKVALVTGASRGTGHPIASHLVVERASVVVNSVTPADAAEAVAAEIRQRASRAIVVCVDVAEEPAGRAMRERVVAERGGLDILVKNAAIAGGLARVGHPDEAR